MQIDDFFLPKSEKIKTLLQDEDLVYVSIVKAKPKYPYTQNTVSLPHNEMYIEKSLQRKNQAIKQLNLVSKQLEEIKKARKKKKLKFQINQKSDLCYSEETPGCQK